MRDVTGWRIRYQIRSVPRDILQRMHPRQRDYVGIRRHQMLTANRLVSVWIIDPIPWSELAGKPWPGFLEA